VGRNLDAVLFVRKPPSTGAVADPQDTDLYDLIGQALPDLPVEDWTYFVVNRDKDNAGQIEFFKSELEKKKIRTRKVFSVNCFEKEDSLGFFDEALSDIADNL